jgi:hypothetical protein
VHLGQKIALFTTLTEQDFNYNSHLYGLGWLGKEDFYDKTPFLESGISTHDMVFLAEKKKKSGQADRQASILLNRRTGSDSTHVPWKKKKTKKKQVHTTRDARRCPREVEGRFNVFENCPQKSQNRRSSPIALIGKTHNPKDRRRLKSTAAATEKQT